MGHKVSHFFKDTVGGNLSHGFRSFGHLTSDFARHSFHTVGHGFSSGWHTVGHGFQTVGRGFDHYVIHPVVHAGGTVVNTFEHLHPLNIITLPLKLVMPHRPPVKRNVGGVHPTLEESNHLNSNTTQEREMLGYAALIAGGAIIIYLVM